MRTLNRNKQTIYYALYNGNNVPVDRYGDPTGEPIPTYDTPVKLRCNVSASRGTAESELFGIDINYSKTLCVEGTNCPIKEDSILWIGRTPDVDTKHNYVVVAVAVSLNNTVYAVREVDVT